MCLTIIEVLVTSTVTFFAILSFYKVAKSFSTVVTLQHWPVIVQTILLICWSFGSVCTFSTSVTYFAHLYTYEDVVRLSKVQSFTNFVNLLLLTMMAFIMLKTGKSSSKDISLLAYLDGKFRTE